VIARLLRGERQVLALGGGAFIDPQTRALVRERAISIWLRADLDVLVKRTARRDDRPLLAGGDPRARLAALLDEREPIYAAADLVVDSGKGPLAEVVARVLAALAGVGEGVA
jgi:shikimate kinase